MKIRSILIRNRYIIYTLAGLYFTMGGINLYETQYKKEAKHIEDIRIQLVTEKPLGQAIIRNDCYIFDPATKNTMGAQYQGMIFYILSEDSTQIRARNWAWIWTQSINSLDSCLYIDENIRYHANTTKTGMLFKETKVNILYTNEKKSWSLCQFDFLIRTQNIMSIAQRERLFFWEFPALLSTNTLKSGGIAILPRGMKSHFDETELRVEIRLGLYIILFIAFFLFVRWRLSRFKGKSYTRAVLFRLMFVGIGMSLAIFIHWIS